MSNCKADLSIGHQIINLQDPDGIWDVFEGILMVDNDLRDNGPDYWETSDEEDEDGEPIPLCITKGYDSQLDMIIGEAMKGTVINTAEDFEKVFIKVFAGLSDQEYYGACDYNIIDLGNGTISLAYATGGYVNW